MPELPEVETTLRGISPHVVGKKIVEVDVRERRLRWPVPQAIDRLSGRTVKAASRRAKYILLDVGGGTVILHLGMSGSLRVSTPDVEWRKHDHVGFRFDTGKELRLHDPRRFGCVLFCKGDPNQHELICDLGPEPLSDEFDVAMLAAATAGKRVAIKQLIMNANIVVGVGNIYACEALFMAGIHPARAAGKIGKARLGRLVTAIKEVLGHSIEQGGTTLRDFLNEKGEPGYFAQSLRVYGREGAPCPECDATVKRIVQTGRSTFYCPRCQR